MLIFKTIQSYFSGNNGWNTHRRVNDLCTRHMLQNCPNKAKVTHGRYTFVLENNTAYGVTVQYNSNAKADKALRMCINGFPQKRFTKFLIAAGVKPKDTCKILGSLRLYMTAKNLGHTVYGCLS